MSKDMIFMSFFLNLPLVSPCNEEGARILSLQSFYYDKNKIKESLEVVSDNCLRLYCDWNCIIFFAGQVYFSPKEATS